MSTLKPVIAPCLWFDSEAEPAAKFYTSVFPNSRIRKISHYTDTGYDVHGKAAGSVLTVEFELDGQTFTALNGGPQFKFSESVSFQVFCDTQDDIDYYWRALSTDGREGVCGWLTDRYGLSWQIVPTVLPDMLTAADRARVDRVLKALMGMSKCDLAKLQQAYAA